MLVPALVVNEVLFAQAIVSLSAGQDAPKPQREGHRPSMRTVFRPELAVQVCERA